MTSDSPIPKNSYVSFDGLSIKEKLKDNLNRSGVFTDQNFEASYLAAFNDQMAFILSYLMFNLSKASSNGMFTETQVYENINRLVKDINYNPIGYQTANVAFSLSAQNIPAGFYTIPRYSGITIGGVTYSLMEDLSFNKIEDNTLEKIQNITNNNILFQGQVFYQENTSTGSPNEIFYITPKQNAKVDNSNIFVYVKEATTGKWERWNKATSFYFYGAEDKVFVTRFNENKIYEIKTGDGINGKILQEGDSICIFYLVSDGATGEIAANSLTNKKISLSNFPILQEILTDEDSSAVYLSSSQASNLLFNNDLPSSNYSDHESVEEIKKNAPGLFRSQFSLTTAQAVETSIRTAFSYIIHDTHVLNNKSFTETYNKYFYDLGLTNPSLESRALFNQITFADACNFNNVYCVCVPRSNSISNLSPDTKNFVLEHLNERKVLTSEIIILDPVYLAFDFAISAAGTYSISDTALTDIIVTKSSLSRKNDISLIESIAETIEDFFAKKNNILGQEININQLSTNILAIDGVQSLKLKRQDTGVELNGLNLVFWNPVYPSTVNHSSTIFRLENFQFPFLNLNSNLRSRIKIVDG